MLGDLGILFSVSDYEVTQAPFVELAK